MSANATSRPFAEGQVFRDTFCADAKTIAAFAEFSEDYNPVHVNADEARSYGFMKPVAHGVILTTVISRIIGMQVPGPGAVWMSHHTDWLEPVFEGDTINVEVTIAKYSRAGGIMELSICATNQRGATVMKGDARVKESSKITQYTEKQSQRRVALVVGGSRGIGAAIAKSLAEAGHAVAILYRADQAAAEAVAADIRQQTASKGPTANLATIQGDVTSTPSMEAAVADVRRQLGAPEVVVHAATPLVPEIRIEAMTEDDLQRYVDAYLLGAYRLVSLCRESMQEQQFGRFIFLGTSCMLQPPRGMGAYAAGKYAMYGYMRSVAMELGMHGITANMVSPSMAVTDLTADIPIRFKEMTAAKSPARRLVSVEEIAGTVSYLASPAAGYMNGVNLPLIGGPC